MNRSSLIVTLAVFVGLLFVGFYLGSPYLAANSLKNAFHSGDRDALADDIDFPSVRESLKSELNAAMLQKLRTDPDMKNNIFAGLGAMFGPVLVDKMLDAYVTPDSIANLSKARAGIDGGGTTSPFQSVASGKFRSDYRTLNRFDIVNDDARGSLTFVMKRSGLFRWRVERIDIPASFFEDGTPKAETSSVTPEAEPQASPRADVRAVSTDAGSETAAFNDEPNFAAYPAEPFVGIPTRPDFSGRDRKAAMFHTRILDAVASGPRFAGSFALAEFGCGTDCATGYVVNLRTGEVLDLPVGGEEDPDMQIVIKPNSRLMVVFNQIGGMSAAPAVCGRRLYEFDGRQFRRRPEDVRAAGTCPDVGI